MSAIKPQKRQSTAGTVLSVALKNTQDMQLASAEPQVQHIGDTGLTAQRLARHVASLVDCLVGQLCCGQPVSVTGRMILKDAAERLRELAEAIR